jgi:hypothetical protein
MPSKQITAARKNIKKAAGRKKRTIAHPPKSMRTALGKKGAQRKRSRS